MLYIILSTYRILKTNQTGHRLVQSYIGPGIQSKPPITLSGATDKSNYALAFNYFDNKGIVLGTYFKRYSLRVNTEFKPAHG